MSKSLEIASDIVAGKKLIEAQKEKIKKLHQELVQSIHQEYPIISLVGSPMVYTRASWGRIEENAVRILGNSLPSQELRF